MSDHCVYCDDLIGGRARPNICYTCHDRFYRFIDDANNMNNGPNSVNSIHNKHGSPFNAYHNNMHGFALSPEFSQRLLRMCTDPQFHDVSFILTNPKTNKPERIGANKALICVHSPVFEAMFKKSLNHKNIHGGHGGKRYTISSSMYNPHFRESSENVVELPGMDINVFKHMLYWMATDRLELNSITILQGLLQIADYYQIDGLLRTCSHYLRSNTITIHVICDSTLQSYHGIDLGLNIEHLRQISVRIRILEKSSVRHVKEAIAKHFGKLYFDYPCTTGGKNKNTKIEKIKTKKKNTTTTKLT